MKREALQRRVDDDDEWPIVSITITLVTRNYCNSNVKQHTVYPEEAKRVLLKGESRC